MRRRYDDTNDEGVLSRGARPAWQVLVFIGGILTAAATTLAVDYKLSVAYAGDVVAPVEKRVSAVEQFIAEERESRQMLSRKIDALCRATPGANCPLGDR